MSPLTVESNIFLGGAFVGSLGTLLFHIIFASLTPNIVVPPRWIESTRDQNYLCWGSPEGTSQEGSFVCIYQPIR